MKANTLFIAGSTIFQLSGFTVTQALEASLGFGTLFTYKLSFQYTDTLTMQVLSISFLSSQVSSCIYTS